MARVYVNTTVDEHLLAKARLVGGESTDGALLDAALASLLALHRTNDIDAAYAAYDERPLDEPDEWGSLAAFHDAVKSS